MEYLVIQFKELISSNLQILISQQLLSHLMNHIFNFKDATFKEYHMQSSLTAFLSYLKEVLQLKESALLTMMPHISKYFDQQEGIKLHKMDIHCMPVQMN